MVLKNKTFRELSSSFRGPCIGKTSLHQKGLPSFLATAESFFSSTRPNPMSSSSRSSRTWAASCDRQAEKKLKKDNVIFEVLSGPLTSQPFLHTYFHFVYPNHHWGASYFRASKALDRCLALSKLERNWSQQLSPRSCSKASVDSKAPRRTRAAEHEPKYAGKRCCNRCDREELTVCKIVVVLTLFDRLVNHWCCANMSLPPIHCVVLNICDRMTSYLIY